MVGQGTKQRVGVACLFSQRSRHLCWAYKLVLSKIFINVVEKSGKSDDKVHCCCYRSQIKLSAKCRIEEEPTAVKLLYF